MSGPNEEIEQLKASVSCAVVLERLPPVWRLDVAESTRRSLKYRRGSGEILIVNHDGRGWWDPLSTAKGDIFNLVRHLDPKLDFAQAKRLLQGFTGMAPTFPAALLAPREKRWSIPLIRRWERRPLLTPDSPAGRYLTDDRGLPTSILHVATADLLREGPQGSAWFAHLDHAGQLRGIEMRGPACRRFSAGGDKTLFLFPASSGRLPRLVVCEAVIDALSLAAIEGIRADTLYGATAGGIGPGTLQALRHLISDIADHSAAVLVAATDADQAGDAYADTLAALATEAALPYVRLRPPDGAKDWNDLLCRQRRDHR